MSLWGISVLSKGSRASLLLVVSIVIVAFGSAAHARQRPGRAGELTSAEECGRCHQDIHRYWKASRHAQSSDSPRFQQAFLKAKADAGADPGCLTCHAPAAVYMRDTKWEKKTSWEGVTCDFCQPSGRRAAIPHKTRPARRVTCARRPAILSIPRSRDRRPRASMSTRCLAATPSRS